jgi:hypothetical protein
VDCDVPVVVSSEVLRVGMPLPPSTLPPRFYQEALEPVVQLLLAPTPGALHGTTAAVPLPASGGGSAVSGVADLGGPVGAVAADVVWDARTKQWKRCVVGMKPSHAMPTSYPTDLKTTLVCG